MVSSCMLIGGCRVWFLMHTSYRFLDIQRFGLRMTGMLLALFASCIFPLRLHASLPRTYNWLFSMMSASCLGLRPPAAMTGGWFPPEQALSSTGLLTLSWSIMIALSFLELAEKDCFGHVHVFHPYDVVSPGQLHLKQDGLNAGQAGPLEDFFVWRLVLPFDARDGAQAASVKPLKYSDLLLTENPGLLYWVVVIEKGTLMRGSSTWKHEGMHLHLSDCKRGVVCHEGFIYMETWRDTLTPKWL